MYDIAIIGLGPAGAFLARFLSRDFRVIAIDRKRGEGEGGFCKPCGGLLAPDAQKSLARFGMTLPKDILVDPQIFSVRTIDVESEQVRHYQRHYINMDRHKFDRWLISHIPGHVEIIGNAACTGIERDGETFTVRYDEGGGVRTVSARYVVGADGAASVVRRCLFGDFFVHKYIAIQQWFPDTHGAPFYSCVFDSGLTDSYAWGLAKDGIFVFGGAFPVIGGRERFERLKRRLGEFGFSLENPVKTEACLALRPAGLGNFCLGGDGAFLIGEAAGFISPSSLEGISYAIDSGYALAGCFNRAPASPDGLYKRATRDIRRRLALKTLKRPFLYHPTIRRVIMKSGICSVPIISPRAVAHEPHYM